MMFLVEFAQAWVSPQFSFTAIKVAMVVGSILMVLNHGTAIIQGEMTVERWLSALLTYLVPYTVNIHGQWIAQLRSLPPTASTVIRD